MVCDMSFEEKIQEIKNAFDAGMQEIDVEMQEIDAQCDAEMEAFDAQCDAEMELRDVEYEAKQTFDAELGRYSFDAEHEAKMQKIVMDFDVKIQAIKNDFEEKIQATYAERRKSWENSIEQNRIKTRSENGGFLGLGKKITEREIQIETRHNFIGMKFILIPAGKFMMSSQPTEQTILRDEGPIHEVTISKSFYIGAYHVTGHEWDELGVRTPCLYGWDEIPGSGNKKLLDSLCGHFGSTHVWCETAEIKKIDSGRTIMIEYVRHGVKNHISISLDIGANTAHVNIGSISYELIVRSENGKLNIYRPNSSHYNNMFTWNEAHEFIKKLNEREGVNKYRLPSVAEWVYACSAGTTTGEGSWRRGSNINGYWCYHVHSHPSSAIAFESVNAVNPNPWGMYDVNNDGEWIDDCGPRTNIMRAPGLDCGYHDADFGISGAFLRVVRDI